MKVAKKIWGGIAVLSAFMVCSSTVLAAFTELAVPLYKQQKSNWCWAAAAEMAGKFKYSSSTVTQADIVAKIKGNSTVNEAGSTSETAKSIEYVTGGYYGASSTILFRWGWDKVKTSIDNNYPVVPLVNDGSSGHYYVIVGYNSTDASIAVNDPWDGQRYECTWADFDAGDTSNGWKESRPHKYTVYYDNWNK